MDRLKEELKSMPDPQAPRFQQTLRRELLAAMQPAPARGLKAALAATATAVVVLAGMLVSFVISPDLPRRINSVWLQDDSTSTRSVAMVPAASPASATEEEVQQAILRRFIEQGDGGARQDQDFLETWYSSQARPARVKTVRNERFLAIRQFELANGERVAVLTDLGTGAQSRTVDAQPAVARGRTY
jgi:hypothetical protein